MWYHVMYISFREFSVFSRSGEPGSAVCIVDIRTL